MLMERSASGLRFYVYVILVGVVAGLSAIFFRELISLFQHFFFYGEFSFSNTPLQHAAPSRFGIGVIAVPVVGAIAVAYLVKNHAREARGSGVPEVLKAIYYQRGHIRSIVLVVRALASAISIGSGASVGREGPIIQMGAAFGATIEAKKFSTAARNILIACGAAGGIAASFNTPFTGVLFAMEVLLPEWSVATILPVIIASAMATYTSYLYYGNVVFMPITATVMQLTIPSAISYFLLSLFLGGMSAFFIVGMDKTENFIDRLHPNDYVKHMFGMFLVGVSMVGMLFFFGHYYIEGLGYATVYDVLTGLLTHPGFLLFLAFFKMLNTAFSIGSGASGGIFSPLVFIGACLGAGAIGVCHAFFPTIISADLQFAALAGIAALVGATTGAPLMGIIMAAELTQNYAIILPLMVMVAIATRVRQHFINETIFTYRLKQQGYAIPDTLQSVPQVVT